MSAILEQISDYVSGLYMPKIQPIDVVEILIITVLLYFFMVWIQRTRAYTLLKGILTVLLFVTIAAVFHMTAILWITQRLASVALIALVIIFQPELRKALESLGNKNILSNFLPFDTGSERMYSISDQSIGEIVRAVNDMSEAWTGALIVIEQKILLTDYIDTGISIDGAISSGLLVNIFEKNTPLHDGAVIIRANKVASATCYLPLSDNAQINKKYGTRHRAGLGISEVSDAFTIIVSEETGRVSCSYMGELMTGVTESDLREQLFRLQKGSLDKERSDKITLFRKGREKA